MRRLKRAWRAFWHDSIDGEVVYMFRFVDRPQTRAFVQSDPSPMNFSLMFLNADIHIRELEPIGQRIMSYFMGRMMDGSIMKGESETLVFEDFQDAR